MTRIGVVSDTHGHLGTTRQAVAALHEQAVDLVIHCGDIGSTDVVHLFGAWPTHFVFGNVDRDEGRLRHAIDLEELKCHGRFGSLEVDGRQIAFLHSDDQRLFQTTIQSGEWDLVCYGHTHVARHEKIGSTHVLNPGALYRAATHTIALVDLPEITVQHISLPPLSAGS